MDFQTPGQGFRLPLMPPSDMPLLTGLASQKPAGAAPAAAVIASGGACGGLFVPRVPSGF
jgi:hypothetical protein